jgi:hypothetical protein
MRSNGITRPWLCCPAFARPDVMHVRVIEDLESKGIDRRDVAAALGSGHLSLGYLESGGRRHPRSDLTFARLSAR